MRLRSVKSVCRHESPLVLFGVIICLIFIINIIIIVEIKFESGLVFTEEEVSGEDALAGYAECLIEVCYCVRATLEYHCFEHGKVCLNRVKKEIHVVDPLDFLSFDTRLAW